MLLRKAPAAVMELAPKLWPPLFRCLCNPSEEVTAVLIVNRLACNCGAYSLAFIRDPLTLAPLGYLNPCGAAHLVARLTSGYCRWFV